MWLVLCLFSYIIIILFITVGLSTVFLYINQNQEGGKIMIITKKFKNLVFLYGGDFVWSHT
ncbi:hypothetical protein C3E89_01250 [Clostridium sp. Cult1]|nr:hypothetical protein [Clostridium sp. Cult1]